MGDEFLLASVAFALTWRCASFSPTGRESFPRCEACEMSSFSLREKVRMRVRGDDLESICRTERWLLALGHRLGPAFHLRFSAGASLPAANGRHLRRREENSAPSFPSAHSRGVRAGR